MEKTRAKKERQSQKEPGFFKRHWKGIAVGVTAVVGFGVGLYLILHSQHEDGTLESFSLPESKELPLPDFQRNLSEGLPTREGSDALDFPRSYVWREEGHDVAGHVRHYQNGNETYVHPYYKPTGLNSSDVA